MTAPRALDGWPSFVQELDATLAVHSQYVLWGNVNDSFLVRDGQTRQLGLLALIWETLQRSGFTCLLIHDPIDGLSVYPPQRDGSPPVPTLAQLLGSPVQNGRPSREALPGHLRAVVNSTSHRVAIVLSLASRLSRNPTQLDAEEHEFFVACANLSRTALPNRIGTARPTFVYNPVIWLADHERDLPAWLTAGNAKVRAISVPYPDFGDRQETAQLLARSFGITNLTPGSRESELCESFAAQAEGLTLQGMFEATRLALERSLDFSAMPDAVRTYKLGVLDNPWQRDFVRRRIIRGENEVGERVIGQPQAVTKTLDILKRAALGLSGAQASQSSTRPRGVLFFAGPTGVGKTELAKTMSKLVFGDETAYLRFDMSEFSAEHAGDRLIGAPPGYVGYEQGGELTNAVRQQPFRVILFDEIEKAHPRILDKFLQILEDGRLTDGRGSTVHFSETILVFTSNLGMYVKDASGALVPNVTPGTPYSDLETLVKAAISDHFTRVLNRPELLNRFGDNIVIFDFISRAAAEQIFELLLRNIVNRVADQHGAPLVVSHDVARTLAGWCTADLEKGGRGVGTALESNFVNPLARALFPRELQTGVPVKVIGIERSGSIVTLELE